MEPEQHLIQALAEWRKAMTAADSTALVASLHRLDALRSEHLASIDPQLAHFLERRSYEKAERWLASEAA
jgi:hypothetical protein